MSAGTRHGNTDRIADAYINVSNGIKIITIDYIKQYATD